MRDGEEGGGEAKTNVGKLNAEPKELIRNELSDVS